MQPITSRIPAPTIGEAGIERARFGVDRAGAPVDVVTLTNAHGMEMRFIAYGGIILSLKAPDRHGVLADVTLGHDSLDAYFADELYFGALIGRYANRIGGARFSLHGREYRLERNEGANHLHGGTAGFHRRTWSVAPFTREGAVGAVLGLTSVAGEGGYPGTLDVRVTYSLTDANALVVDYRAATDEPTPVNMTQHAYFNLAGHDGGDVLDHELTIVASRITPVDASLIPTGELRSVCGTPFDFSTPRRIGERIDANDDQIRIAQGYDHNFVLDQPSREVPSFVPPFAPTFAARLREPHSGRTLDVLTTEPGLHLCVANELHQGYVGKHGRPYARRSGLALETQHFPDSPNQPHFPSTIVSPGVPFTSRTVFQFGVE
ncbi:MAG: galactose mutarotase [Gemmatirosa sp.]|nr:galactose mutarotase [Gemmatirosa sp.]